jgi:hypothetical protein
LELLLTFSHRLPPQQTKSVFAGDPGRGGLNNSALAGLGSLRPASFALSNIFLSLFSKK